MARLFGRTHYICSLQSMNVVILSGGLGTRLAEDTVIRPKPMIEIGGRPILWHIMKHYAHYDVKEFFLALGHRGEVIKRFFVDYSSLGGSLSIDLSSGRINKHDRAGENWIIHLRDTGQDTNTGGRLKRLEQCLKGETFMLTYGDGVSDLDLGKLLEFHRAQGRIATVTAVRPPARFGGLIFDGDLVSEFTEKPQIGEGWINGGFLVFEPEIFNYLKDDDASLEANALEQLAGERQLAAYRHEGFWQCMDTPRDKRLLENLWHERRAPWKVWEDSPGL
jgi:glucose-1-phosphate cytidylyltransferase